jgi:hypothetical protein
MILILVFHTEVYFKEFNVTPYYIYTTNAIVLFYFISGYLTHHSALHSSLRRIVRSLLIPYFVFTSLIALPKVFIRGSEINLADIAVHILSGRASWFIVALMVAELMFILLLWISRGKHSWLFIVAVICFVTYYLIPFNQHNYWQWQDALLAFDFLYAGYLYRQYASLFHTINRPFYSFLFLLLLITIKIYEYPLNLPMRNIAIENIPLFLADSIVWLLLVITLIRYIPRQRMVEWTGQHSIVYYFMAGGCPLVVSILMRKAGLPYDGYMYRYWIALALTYVLATAITWLIYRYIPYITGKKNE